MNKPLLVAGGLITAGGLYLLAKRAARGPTSSVWPGWISPVRGVVSGEGWGDARPYRDGWHEGIDLYCQVGTAVRAVEDGVVDYIDAKDDSFAGVWLQVKHPKSGLMSRYLHLSAIYVYKGQLVKQGDVIAQSGRSGGISSSTASHLHFDVRADANAVAIYTQLFGRPTPDVVYHTDGWAVPAEPLVPAEYGPRAIANAEQHNVKIWTA